MPRKVPAFDYRARARQLREYGYKVSYGQKGKTGNQYKTQVRRQWNKVRQYVENTKQEFIWQKSSGEEYKLAKEGLSSKQFTPTGFFLRKAKSTRGSPKLKKTGKNKLTYTATGSKGGKVIETIHRISWKLLMEDPPKAILMLGRPGDKVILTVNGFDSSQTIEYSLQSLAYYLALDLLPKFLDPNLDEAYTKAHGRRKGSKRDKLRQFTDIFHVKVIRHIRPKKKKVLSRGKAKRNRRR